MVLQHDRGDFQQPTGGEKPKGMSGASMWSYGPNDGCSSPSDMEGRAEVKKDLLERRGLIK